MEKSLLFISVWILLLASCESRGVRVDDVKSAKEKTELDMEEEYEESNQYSVGIELDPAQYYGAVFARFDQGQEDAWAMLENMPNEFRLSTAQEEEWIAMQQYLAFLENLKSNERTIVELTEDEISELIGISETQNGGSAAGWASNALCFHYAICKPATATEAPELIAGTAPKANDEEIIETLKETSFRIVPNPTSDEARLISIDNQQQTQSLSVFDVNGRRILFQNGANHQRFDTSSLPNGVYFCRIVALTGEVENIKFIVNH